MTTGKRDRMTIAACTRAVLSALDEHNLTGVVSTVHTSKAGCWAVTTVKATGGTEGRTVGAALALSRRIPSDQTRVAGSYFGRTVKLWWKA